MGELGFVVLIAAVVGVPLWLSRGVGKKVKEKVAPVPARSTTVVLSDAPTSPAPSLLSQVVIRTGPGRVAGLSTQASGSGLCTHVKDVAHHDHTHGVGHGHGGGHR